MSHPGEAGITSAVERARLAHEIALMRLTPGQTRKVIRANFNQPQMRGEFLDVIQARTDGNPFCRSQQMIYEAL